MINEKILDNLNTLINEGNELKIGNKYNEIKSDMHQQQCHAWIASALHTMQLIFPNKDSAYQKRFSGITSLDGGSIINQQVGALTGIMEYVKRDIENGLLMSIADSARAEVFDDFIYHAEEYLKMDLKNEAGVIAGVVFEDSVRRLCSKHSISQSGIKLDQLISELSKQSIITATKAKRFRVAAHIRTKATHAQWDEFGASDVEETIRMSRDLIENYLDAAV